MNMKSLIIIIIKIDRPTSCRSYVVQHELKVGHSSNYL